MLGRPRGAATHWHSGRRSRSPAEGVKVRCGRVGRAGSGVWAIQQLHTLHPVGLTCIVLPRPISSPRSIRPSHRSTAAATPSRWNGSSASWSVSEAVDGIALARRKPNCFARQLGAASHGWPDIPPRTSVAQYGVKYTKAKMRNQKTARVAYRESEIEMGQHHFPVKMCAPPMFSYDLNGRNPRAGQGAVSRIQFMLPVH